jgi:hypothetical protein
MTDRTTSSRRTAACGAGKRAKNAARLAARLQERMGSNYMSPVDYRAKQLRISGAETVDDQRRTLESFDLKEMTRDEKIDSVHQAYAQAFNMPEHLAAAPLTPLEFLINKDQICVACGKYADEGHLSSVLHGRKHHEVTCLCVARAFSNQYRRPTNFPCRFCWLPPAVARYRGRVRACACVHPRSAAWTCCWVGCLAASST